MVTLAFDPAANIGAYFGEGGTEGKSAVEYFSDGVRLIDAAGAAYDAVAFQFPMDGITYEGNFPATINRISVCYLVPNGVSLTGLTLAFADGSTADLDTDVHPLEEAPAA